MNRPLQIVLAAVAVAAIVLLGVRLLPGPNVSVEPSASPSPLQSSAAHDLLNGFLEARIAGEGAQQYLSDPEEDIPLLYATTSGAPYDRAEFERVLGIEWPYGDTAFLVRLFAGDTVVEQLFFAGPDSPLLLGYEPDGFGTDIAPTTEDGQPVAVPYNAFEGEVTLHLAHPWVFRTGSTSIQLIPEGPGVRPTTDGGERNLWDRLVLMADPERGGSGCPTGASPANAEALAEIIRSDPNLQATAPVAVSVGGAEGLMLDVAVAAGATGVCGSLHGQTELQRVEVVNLTAGHRMRLWLFDAPEASSMQILAVAIVVPESQFERAAAAAASLSVEFSTK